MQTAGLLAQGLVLVELGEGLVDMGGLGFQAACYGGDAWLGGGEAVYAAQPAACAPVERAAALFELGEAFAGDFQAGFYAVGRVDDFAAVELAGALQDVFADAEPERELGNVLRGCHDDGVGDAVVHQGDGGFLREGVLDGGEVALLIACDGAGLDGGGSGGHGGSLKKGD
ncbi:hypothetical protein GCWU000324_00379 [Kingella oralis ATCC 51147]|uniref:Uncharacterized protein n=1 Tax=Kingella oralis ATCC 51147 TaxID=629741 RepID=C4GHP5_9NEIS|nr:hypothetical protein GCWU000324_00379 [Kingella oralis ATCC 51147]